MSSEILNLSAYLIVDNSSLTFIKYLNVYILSDLNSLFLSRRYNLAT